LAATYLVGKGLIEAGVAAYAEGVVFMKKLGGFIAGLAAKGIGRLGGRGGIAGGIGKFGMKGGGPIGGSPSPEGPAFDAKPVEDPKELPGGRGAPADRILEAPEPPIYRRKVLSNLVRLFIFTSRPIISLLSCCLSFILFSFCVYYFKYFWWNISSFFRFLL